MDKIEKTVNEALKLVRTPFDSNKIIYGQYASIYLAPTGNVKDMMANFSSAKRVLAVGGAGAFGLEAAINGAKEVNMFDCNELQRCFFELVKASITILRYEEFMQYFTLKDQSPTMPRSELKDLLSPVLFFKVCDLLPYDVLVLYHFLYSNFDNVGMVYSSLYRYCHAMYREYLVRFASMYDEEKYYELQNILRKKSCKINYEQASLIDLPKKYTGPYDLIVLGNILQYYLTIPGLDTPYEVDKFIKKELSKLLAPNGTIQVNYGFIYATIGLKRKLGLPHLENGYSSSYIGNKMIEMNMKKDINIALMARGGYDFTTIEGVESMEKGEPAENIVLTFKPINQKKS